jgi:hypothetical protein
MSRILTANKVNNHASLNTGVKANKMNTQDYIKQEFELIKNDGLTWDFLESQTCEILGHFIGHDRKVSSLFFERFEEWLFNNYEHYLVIVELPNPFTQIKQYPLYTPLELELSPSTVETISDKENLFINDNGYGYINTGYDFIGIDLSTVNPFDILRG